MLLWALAGCELVTIKPMDPCLDPRGSPLVRLDVGARHACGATDAGAVTCWGDDGAGQVSGLPDDLVGFDVALGGDVSCSGGADALVTCWGSDAFGQVSGLPDDRPWHQVDVGAEHGCAVDEGRAETLCFGDNADGRLDVVLSGGPYLKVAVGERFSCGMDLLGRIECWGSDDDQVITDAPDGTVTDLAAGDRHACILDQNQEPFCWGANDEGQLDVVDGPYGAIHAGLAVSCGQAVDGTLTCWGGSDAQDPPDEPLGIVGLSGESRNACAVGPESSLLCWGDDSAIIEGPP